MEEDPDRSYEFKYQVTAEDSSEELEFGHEEKADDDNVVGSYFVELPDGRTLKVSFLSRKNQPG